MKTRSIDVALNEYKRILKREPNRADICVPEVDQIYDRAQGDMFEAIVTALRVGIAYGARLSK